MRIAPASGFDLAIHVYMTPYRGAFSRGQISLEQPGQGSGLHWLTKIERQLLTG